jgi:hydrogenase maturation factor
LANVSEGKTLIPIEPDNFDAVLPSLRCKKAVADRIGKIAAEKNVHKSVVIRAAIDFFLQNYVSEISANGANVKESEGKTS